MWLGEGGEGSVDHGLFQQGPGLTKHSLLQTGSVPALPSLPDTRAGTSLLASPSPPHPAQSRRANLWAQGSASPSQDLRSSAAVTSAVSPCSGASITSSPSQDGPAKGRWRKHLHHGSNTAADHSNPPESQPVFRGSCAPHRSFQNTINRQKSNLRDVSCGYRSIVT